MTARTWLKLINVRESLTEYDVKVKTGIVSKSLSNICDKNLHLMILTPNHIGQQLINELIFYLFVQNSSMHTNSNVELVKN